MKSFLLSTLIFSLLTCSQGLLAADLYRCGASYQATPCATKKMPASKTVAPISNKIDANEKPPIIPLDADCRRRGSATKKIMALREIGKTESEQLANTRSASYQALIKDVYKFHGTAFQVKTAIERECMQKKRTADNTKAPQNIIPKPSVCGSIKAKLDDINQRRINGGAYSYLDDLQQQQTVLMQEMKAAGCFH
jgi:hypothetical protein